MMLFNFNIFEANKEKKTKTKKEKNKKTNKIENIKHNNSFEIVRKISKIITK